MFKYKHKLGIMSLFISITLLLIGLFVKGEIKPLYIILGEAFFFIGILLSTSKQYNKNNRHRTSLVAHGKESAC